MTDPFPSVHVTHASCAAESTVSAPPGQPRPPTAAHCQHRSPDASNTDDEDSSSSTNIFLILFRSFFLRVTAMPQEVTTFGFSSSSPFKRFLRTALLGPEEEEEEEEAAPEKVSLILLLFHQRRNRLLFLLLSFFLTRCYKKRSTILILSSIRRTRPAASRRGLPPGILG